MIFSSQLGKLDGQTSEQAVKTIANHLRKVQEELEYRLGNLDSTNVTEIDTGLTEMRGPLVQLIAENEEAVAQLIVAGNEIRAEVSRELEGLSSTVSQTAVQLRSEFTNMKMEVESSFDQTASEIRAEVSSELANIESAFSVQMGQITGKVNDLQTGMSHALKLDSNGVYIVDQDGNQVAIQGGQIEATGLKITSANLPEGLAMKSDIPTSTSQLTNNSGFTSLSAVQSYVSNLGYTNATGVVSIINGTVNADFINALGVTARYLSGDVITVNNGAATYAIMYAGRNSSGTTAFELYGTNGLRLTAGGNVYMCSSGGQVLNLGKDGLCQLTGGPLVIDTNSYGPLSNRPGTGTYGQVYFVLE